MSGALRFCLLLVLIIFSTACNPPPFNSYDPPPTFAYKLVPQDPRLGTQHLGATLDMMHLADAIHPSFLPTGTEYAYQSWSTFNVWKTVTNGRWPALWRVASIGGCGYGTSGNFHISSKLSTFGCSILNVPIGVNPSSYSSTAPPGTLSLQFGGGAGMPVSIYVVDPNTSTVISGPISTTLNGSAQVSIAAPSGLGPGNYYVLAESSASTTTGGSGDFTVYTPSPPPSGGDTLQPAQRLYAGQWVYSQSSSYGLTYQSDGNLVLYGPSGPTWATMVSSSAGRAEMQTDGNFVTYDAGSVPLWNSATFEAGSVLRVENQGLIQIYGPNGNVIWSAP